MGTVIFSSRAYNAIISEAIDKDPVETGGILLGHVIPGGLWVVTEVVPPGSKSINRRAYFEYDENYVNYTANVMAKQYQIPPRALGLWHRHPGSMDVFSGVDDKTNRKFAALNSEYGAISCLVNFDPKFRLTVYRVTLMMGFPRYERIPFEIGDQIIPEKYFQLRYFHPEYPSVSEDQPVSEEQTVPEDQLDSEDQSVSEDQLDSEDQSVPQEQLDSEDQQVSEEQSDSEDPTIPDEQLVLEAEQQEDAIRERENEQNASREVEDDSVKQIDNVSGRKPTVAFPTTLENFTGTLYGVYSPETNYFNVVAPDSGLHQKVEKIGYIFEEPPFKDMSVIQFQNSDSEDDSINNELSESSWMSVQRRPRFNVEMLTDSAQAIFQKEQLTKRSVLGYRTEQGLVFVSLLELKSCVMESYNLKKNAFSRNAGISDVMVSKKTVLIGCGSVGSLAALELARAGVGRFLLIDSGILGYQDLSCHQCGALEVGRFKTDCLKERIEQINPYAEVVTAHGNIQRVSPQQFCEFCDENTIFIAATDNREDDLYASELAKGLNSAFISVGCWEGAYAGEIFYCLPSGMPDYSDYMKCIGSGLSGVAQNGRFYSTEAKLEKDSYEPGFAVDIDFITIVAVKLALDILNRDNPHYTPRAINRLTQLTLICNACTENDPLFTRPLTISSNIRIKTAD